MNDKKNNINLILEDYLTWEKVKVEKNYKQLLALEKDKLRLKYDKDAKYYKSQINKVTGKKYTDKEALFADVIISFWTPYKRLLELEAEWCACKTEKSLSALLRQINSNKETSYSQKIKNVNNNALVKRFAQICYTKGNFMILPKREMNNERYKITNDRIDMTLYECFDKGKLSDYFKNDELKEWIEAQNLNLLFTDGNICRENINWFVKNSNQKLISKMSAPEIYEYLENAINFINSRNKLLSSEE